MSPLAQRVAATVYQNFPHVLCFNCLAAQQGLKEHDIRAVALVLIARAGLGFVRRLCSLCQRTDEVLVPQKVTAALPGMRDPTVVHIGPLTKESGS